MLGISVVGNTTDFESVIEGSNPSSPAIFQGGGVGKINSRAKGAAAELQFSHYLKDHGYEARRGQQFSGGDDSPDVVSNIDFIHWEVKRVEALQVYKSVEQAKRDAGEGRIPVVAHRKNREEWLAILPMEDFMKLIKEYGGKKCES